MKTILRQHKKEFKRHFGRFSVEIIAKLLANEVKYQFGNRWKIPDWKEKCQKGLRHHADKGDPRDVAIYAFFCWYHKWPTGPLLNQLWVSTADGIIPTVPLGTARRHWVSINGRSYELWWLNEMMLAGTEGEFTASGWHECRYNAETGHANWYVPYNAIEHPITHFMEQLLPPAPPARSVPSATELADMSWTTRRAIAG